MNQEVLAHRLQSLIEGIWMNAKAERLCREAGLDPIELQAACREKLERIAANISEDKR